MSVGLMVAFKLTLLLCFAPKDPAAVKKGKPGHKINGSDTKPFQPEYATVIEFAANELVNGISFEYELLPSKFKYQAQVYCYGPVAKFVSRDSDAIIKTREDRHGIWVPIHIEHYTDELSLEDIRKLHRHVMEIKFTESDRGKDVPRFNLNYNNVKYAGEFENVQKQPSLISIDSMKRSMKSKMSMKSKHQSIRTLTDVITTLGSGKSEIVSQIIEKENEGNELFCKMYAPSNLIGENDKAGRKENNETLKKKKKNWQSADQLSVHVPAEVFFTDPTQAIYNAQKSNSILRKAYIITSVDHLLTKTQKLHLNILVIKVRKINNFPVDILKEKGIESVYAFYDIPFIGKCKTAEKPVVEKVVFDEARAYFTDSVPKMKLIEFAQTQKLCVEIYGNRQIVEPEPTYALFGTKAEDANFGSLKLTEFDDRIKPCEGNPVLLMVALYDISSLVDNVWEFKEKAQCHEPNLTLSRKPEGFYNVIEYLDLINVNEINLYSYNRCGALVPESVLIGCGTTLQVEAFLMSPQAPSLVVHQMAHTFKRILVIIRDEQLAQEMYAEVFKHNEAILKDLSKHPKDESELELGEILTGFIIDNGSSYIFYVEGPSTGFILNIWHIVDAVDKKLGKVFFNTDSAFERRLYTNFIREGLYLVTLKIPLQDILSKNIYLRGKVPPPCLEALKKLSLILHSSNLKAIFQMGLLPRPEELISLAFEWGVSMRWKKYPEKVVETVVY